MAFPSDAGTITSLVDGTDYMEAANINNVKTELENVKTFLGTPGAAQSHLASLLSTIADGYIGGRCYKKDADEIYVGTFSGIIKNAAGTVYKLRVSTSVTTLSAADLDTGSFADDTYYYIYATADAAATTPTFVISASASAPTGYTYYRRIGWFFNESAAALDITSGIISTFIGGDNPSQKIVTLNSTMDRDNPSTIIPYDNSPPLNTEGVEYMTCRIIPSNANNILSFEIVFIFSTTDGQNVTLAIFQDDTANALASCGYYNTSGLKTVTFKWKMVAGTTSPTMFKFRAGSSSAADFTFNGGSSGTAIYGGVISSSFSVKEEKA